MRSLRKILESLKNMNNGNVASDDKVMQEILKQMGQVNIMLKRSSAQRLKSGYYHDHIKNGDRSVVTIVV